jgi:hypothetical protein
MNQLTNSQRNVSFVVAIILLSACAAKSWAMVSGNMPVTQLESLLNVILVQAELSLALWLISGNRRDLALATSALFFIGATVVNLSSIWLGKSSCGCFGSIAIPPKVTLILNICILVAIAASLRAANLKSALRFGRIGLTVPLCISFLVIAALVQMSRIQLGKKLLSMPDKIDFGVIEIGSLTEITIPLKNIAGKEISIWGGKTTCTCATIEGLPAFVPRNLEAEVRIAVKPQNLRDINVRAFFYTNAGFTDEFVTLTARVREPRLSE